SLNFVPTSEGYFDFEKNKYIYNYSDHLGNVRLSYFQNGSSIEALEENNYYPFGLKHDGYNILNGNPAYTYSYNNKELQTEMGMYDYGARFYMPDIGRWGVVDPRSAYTHEAYSYVWNNPIRYVDPNGMEGEDPDPKKIYGPKGGKPIEEVTIIPIYRSVKLEPRGIDYSTTGILSGIAMTGSRTPNPYALAAAGIAAIILWNTPKIYQATEVWKRDEMVIDLSPKALPANFAQGQDEADEETDVNGVDVPEEGKLEKSPTGKGSVPPSERDPKRVPTAKEKKAQWTENNKECANCEKEMSLEDTRSHHYPKRWSDGGRKTVPVCKTCHKQLHKK
ncbi:RHS repeat domain-containing protein, partial [Chryseobacterium sp. 8AT]|uniref:RHS repeat domain-containing protein n=2 Tax=Chryseobacterium TaxID=59732 RepID=UPI001628D05B